MKLIKNILYVVIFITLLTISCIATKRLFVSKIHGGTGTIKSFYAQQKNSVDVVFVGSSRIYNNIDPSVLWDEKGIASFDFATSGQLISASVLAVQEIFRTQTPKVVVVESSQIEDAKYVPIEMNSIMTYLKPSRLKYETMYKYSYPGTFADNLINYSYYHNLYSETTLEDSIYWKAYQYPKSGFSGYKGFHYSYKLEDLSDIPSDIIMDEQDFPDVSTKNLQKILDMCRKNGAELMLIYSPELPSHDYTKLHEFADSNNIKYINTNYIFDEIGIDPKEDFRDAVHLNINGAKKLSSYLADILSDEYKVPSHKGDENYYSWEENSEHIKYMAKSLKLSGTTGLGDYFYNFYPDPKYIMILSLIGEYDTDFYGQREVLEKICGINGDLYNNGGTWVFYNYDVEYYSGDCNDMLWHMDIGGHNISVSGKKSEPEIIIDGIDYGITRNGHKLNNGIQVITFDTVQNQLIDAVMFDNDDGFACKRNEQGIDERSLNAF